MTSVKRTSPAAIRRIEPAAGPRLPARRLRPDRRREFAVVKIDKAGSSSCSGDPRQSAGQFSSVHAIAVDKNRRVYIGDRGNDRIQVFDEQENSSPPGRT